MITSTDVTVSREPGPRRYEARIAGRGVAGFVEYRESDGLVVLTHTEVGPSFEGRGVGDALARAALDDIRERGLKALVTCPFIRSWLRRHPESLDVLFTVPRVELVDRGPT